MKKRAQALIDSLGRQGIDVSGINPQLVETLSGAGLRFDRVALRFVDDVRAALHGFVPEGKILAFTITAPLRLASKTAATLEENVRGALARRSASVDLKETINGNRIRVRLLGVASNRVRVVGFVHNPDCAPEILFDAMRSLLRPDAIAGHAPKSRAVRPDRAGARAPRRLARRAGSSRS